MMIRDILCWVTLLYTLLYVHTSVLLFRRKLIDSLSQSTLFYEIIYSTCLIFHLYSVKQIRSLKNIHCK